MAELTNLESKIGEVLGLAMAAQAATKKVEALLGDDDPQLAKVLRGMHRRPPRSSSAAPRSQAPSRAGRQRSSSSPAKRRARRAR
jgi:hypothetical protein